MAKSNDKKLRREMAAKREQQRTKIMTIVLIAILVVALVTVAFVVVRTITAEPAPAPGLTIDELFIDGDGEINIINGMDEDGEYATDEDGGYDVDEDGEDE